MCVSLIVGSLCDMCDLKRYLNNILSEEIVRWYIIVVDSLRDAIVADSLFNI